MVAYNFIMRKGKELISALWWQQQGMVWSCVKEVSGCILEESSLQEVGQALEQVSQCNGQGTKPVGLQKVTEECFQK